MCNYAFVFANKNICDTTGRLKEGCCFFLFPGESEKHLKAISQHGQYFKINRFPCYNKLCQSTVNSRISGLQTGL